MNVKSEIQFGNDKSQILRGLAIIFMIILHNDTLPEFKICVPLFTFLVGYGYAFAKERNLKHAVKRSWRLLSSFWLILFGIFIPTAIWKGGYTPTLENVFLNMFGIESNLNWYSWYIYFYIFAMLAMIPASRIITRFRIYGVLALTLLSLGCAFVIRMNSGWSENIWSQAAFDCFLCSLCLWSGFYLSEYKTITKIHIPLNVVTALILTAIATGIFFLRQIPGVWLLDVVTVPAFAFAIVALFNILTFSWLNNIFISLGKESMNMWFFHAVFATSCTTIVFAPLLSWITPKILLIAAMITISYIASRCITAVWQKI